MSKSSVKRATVYGWEGAGRTIKEAKEDAVARIQRAAEGAWEPVTLCWRGHTAFCWRQPDGWFYSVTGPDAPGDPRHELPPRMATSACTGGIYESRHDATVAMAFHLAQNTFRREDGWEAPPFLRGLPGQERFQSWAWWQILYGNAIEAGCNDYQARVYASAAGAPGTLPYIPLPSHQASA